MATPISRRTILAAGAGAAAGLSLPGVAAHAGGQPTTSVRFRLDATVLDGGEQVTSVTLDTARLGRIDPASLTTGTFNVHAKATSPIPIAADDVIFSEYDLDRPVTAARLDRRGNIVLDLAHAEGQVGGGTLGYILSRGRNVRLDLAYTITQRAPLTLRNGRRITISRFVQGRLSNPEVDAFTYHSSGSGMKYRLYSPTRGGRGKHPLVVWLHGGGEGASLPDDYYDNETTLRANRGALGFATPQAQRIFSGAYVVAPQSTSYWMEDGPRFAPLIREIIRDLVRRHPVDHTRISVAGCSNGGYMSMKITAIYPDLFAGSVPICGVVEALQPGGPRLITDAELTQIDTPTWLVTSLDDTTVPPQPNTIHAHELIPGSLMTLYDHVIWNGHQFPGHWSWIYVARNDPSIDGTHIWQWMAQQRRAG
jgi:predicted peptidase